MRDIGRPADKASLTYIVPIIGGANVHGQFLDDNMIIL